MVIDPLVFKGTIAVPVRGAAGEKFVTEVGAAPVPSQEVKQPGAAGGHAVTYTITALNSPPVPSLGNSGTVSDAFAAMVATVDA